MRFKHTSPAAPSSALPALLALLALLVLPAIPRADGIRPQRFGPFLQQSVSLAGSPLGYHSQPPFGSYNFQAGWMEPIALLPSPLFSGSYLETQANATISPYQSDLGIAFNLRPIRFLEFGIGYNRLLFPYTLAGFHAPDSAPANWLPPEEEWSASKVWNSSDLEAAGADIFTYQANLTFAVGPVQLHGGGFYSLWDVDVQDQDILLEYRTDLLIRKRDRIASLYAQALFQPGPGSSLMGLTASGFGARDQFWWTRQTALSEHLVSVGFSGLHRGWNDNRHYRGLDGWVGFWLDQPQLKGRYRWERLYLDLHWTWNIQILNLSER